MKYTKLRDLTVSRIGLGCMGMSHLFTGKDQPDEVHIATIHRALELGVTFFDTAEIYGPFKNEVLVGKALKAHRDEVVIATKFGLMTGEGEERKLGFDSTPANIRYAVEQSLKRLDMDYIDLYYQHRIDKNVPIEDVIGTLKELIDEGKIGHIGLSEAGQANIRKANAVHPITALQSEYSLWTRDGEDGTLDLLAELGIGFVPYSPLSRGMLSGKITTLDKFDEDDWRLTNPRFLPDAFEKNKEILGEVTSIAAEVGCTPAQLALAWLLAKGADWAPIPGTVRISHLEEDLAAVEVELTTEQVTRLDKVTQPVGGHHNEAQMKMLDREV
ncbi:aryl-alcohol dehydrogenase-like predicted oxidoreductase [Aurantimicrobium minutum]|uniref:aldo/keto reductase n=1 Tax=Aurantimicrobium minutum TaxID=708131 RepID=UPI002476751A|nr:aldo/keto reductase [Aurantimicrobium minutum]MDH6424323.1 aryl-alcohol dehydrogenase-like predicted oxidoreductase [Aurantimicrobium minutum]